MPLKLLLLALGGYIAVAVLAQVMVGRALYFPEVAAREEAPGSIRVSDDEGNTVAVLHLPNPDARFTLWFFHGNAEALGDLLPTLRSLQAEGFAVFAFDYPGYGVSSGRPSESALYASARTARRYLREQLGVSAERTLLYGRSLGGGPAVQMATEERVGGLILQSTFTSVFRVVTRWGLLPFDHFENQRKLPRVTAPVLVMHGTADEVIPFHHGEALWAAAREPKRAFWAPGARHNDFPGAAGAEFRAALRDFSALCARSAGTSAR